MNGTTVVGRVVGRQRYQVRREQKIARRHHVVSKFYLTGFADGSRQLVRVALPGERSHLMSVDDATVAKDFYNVRLSNGEMSDVFERLWGQIETPAAVVLNDVVGGLWPLPPPQKATLASWMALQHLRGQETRSSLTGWDAGMIRLVVGTSGKEALRRHIEQAEGAAVDDARLDAEWSDLTKAGGPTLEDDVEQHIDTILDLIPPTAAILADQQWSLDVFDEPALVTSDHPVILIPHKDQPRWMGVGLATADGWAVPLTRRLALVTNASPGGPDTRLHGHDMRPLAQLLNKGVAAQAQTSVFHHPSDASLLDRVPLPQPAASTWSGFSGDDLIREEGLFSGMSPEQLIAVSKIGGGPTDGPSYSLSDLPGQSHDASSHLSHVSARGRSRESRTCPALVVGDLQPARQARLRARSHEQSEPSRHRGREQR